MIEKEYDLAHGVVDERGVFSTTNRKYSQNRKRIHFPSPLPAMLKLNVILSPVEQVLDSHKRKGRKLKPYVR